MRRWWLGVVKGCWGRQDVYGDGEWWAGSTAEAQRNCRNHTSNKPNDLAMVGSKATLSTIEMKANTEHLRTVVRLVRIVNS